jgi:long-chain fatty acid transport protein
MLFLSAVMIFSSSPFAQGAGFLIYEHGAAAMAMGGAFVGLANNPSAVFHNPAGIAFLDGTQISFGTTLITADASVSLPNWPDPAFQTVDQESQWFYPSTFYITHKFTDRIVAGFGFFSPYGLGTKWPESYPLRYIAIEDDMKTFFFNPVVAAKLTDNFSISGGVSFIHATLSFKLVEMLVFSQRPLVTFDVPATLDASGNGIGFNAGALYKGEGYSVGINFRSGFKIKFDGDLDLNLSQIPLSPIASLAGTASTEFNFPHILGIGGAFNLTENFLLTADLHYVLWSSYDRFVVEVAVPGIEAIYPPGIADKEVEENWEDSFVFRGGVQYQVSEIFCLRAGFLYDQTPQPTETMDPILPDADRWAITGGFGYTSGRFVFDGAFQYEVFKDRTSPNRGIYDLVVINLGEGTYSNTAYLIAVSIGYKF